MSKIDVYQIKWRPDRSSVIPLFKQIYDYMIGKIATGEWSIGSKLPTQIEISKAFAVNRSTILEVYDELKYEGIVESKKSVGTIIINNTWSVLTSNAPTDWNKKISNGLHKPNLDIIRIINDVESRRDLIRLGAGELAREMYPKAYIEEVMTSVSKKMSYMGYGEPKGLLPLREEIAKYLEKKGIKTDASKILIVSGGLQALNLLSIGVLNTGSTILCEKPSYLSSLTLFDSHGIHISSVKVDNEGISINQLISQSVLKKPDLLYLIPNFHNPTGHTISENRRRKLLELCEKERLPIIEDDVYSELWYDNPPPQAMKSLDKNGTVLYIGSISKTLSAGMRVGWIVGNENVIDRLADIKMQTDYGSSNISQWVCYEFLRSGAYEQFTKTLRASLLVKRDLMLKILDENFSDIASWHKPNGGLYIWLKLKKPILLNKLFKSCYDNGIVINPGNLYDPADKQSIRLSFGYAKVEEIEKGLKILSKIIRTF